MHGHNIVHRDLRDTSLFLETTGVRVSDFSIDKRVRELLPASVVDRFPLAIGRGGKKSDIYRLGVLLLSFAVGSVTHDLTVPKGMTPEFRDLVKKCLMRDERERRSASELLDHPWVKNRLETSPQVHNTNRLTIVEVIYLLCLCPDTRIM